jgi:ribosomal protein S18 acetylase RimI-like enzyme
VRKEIADEVLVIQQEETIVGFVTIKSKDGVGEIGLIAVDVSQRRKQYGQRLVQGAMAWCRNQGLFGCCVITQGENKPAGRLYKKCGFEIQKTTYVYHFWI